jgi:hypothetical protein
MFGTGTGRSDDPAQLEAAAGDEHETGLRPMVTARILVD